MSCPVARCYYFCIRINATKNIKSSPPAIKLVHFLLCPVLLEELLELLFGEHGIDDVYDGIFILV